MDISNKVQLTVKDFNKCFIICDSDCPLGEIYDYSCSLKDFIVNKIKENEESQKQKVEEVPQE